MARGLIGKKIGMTQVFDAYGNLVPVTILEAGPNYVIQVKEAGGKDGYNAVKLGFGSKKISHVNRPELGVFKHAGVEPSEVVLEFRLEPDEMGDYVQGKSVGVAQFAGITKIDVTGTSKGKGFQGVIKRHNFKGAKESSHGTHEYKRHGGSIGSSAWPSRVIKGKRMAGQMGDARVTVRDLEVVGIFAEQNLLLVRGSVPGAKNGILRIRPSAKQR
ncbi:MAG: 50S ribosomal protein L3 [Deltaproteobacteria bacterium HGW-Deltaproteobacteria-14]|jgi:large subunit ribosomal protein L3|nr:MAG: 50S ribosomal protein L3 [Deltaproteobacteria bacterium HGW-Deltaproteobacteria-14]